MKELAFTALDKHLGDRFVRNWTGVTRRLLACCRGRRGRRGRRVLLYRNNGLDSQGGRVQPTSSAAASIPLLRPIP